MAALWPVRLAFVSLLITGCVERQEARKPVSPELRRLVGLELPDDTALLGSTDGGYHKGFYAWLVFSPDSIRMPAVRAPGDADYFPLDLANSIQLIKAIGPSQTVPQPQVAYGSDWQADGALFRGTLVRCTGGDYLVIQRFSQGEEGQ